MSKYPKIQTLYLRKEAKKGKASALKIGEYACDEFANIKYWTVTEKIHGTNLRIIWKDRKLTFKPKSDNGKFQGTFKEDYLDKIKDNLQFKLNKFFDNKNVVIYAEACGGNIQDIGKAYSTNYKLVVFDIKIGYWWLNYEKIKMVCDNLGLKCVPLISYFLSIDAIEGYVKDYPDSIFAKEKVEMEGIVATSYPLMLFRRGNPIKFKLKCNDYKKTFGEK